jgi:hypothetical protein
VVSARLLNTWQSLTRKSSTTCHISFQRVVDVTHETTDNAPTIPLQTLPAHQDVSATRNKKRKLHALEETEGIEDFRRVRILHKMIEPQSPIRPELDEETMAFFPSGMPREERLETVICKHCKRPVLKRIAKEHIAWCLKSKQDKARKKKKAREAAARAKKRPTEETTKDTNDESLIMDWLHWFSGPIRAI